MIKRMFCVRLGFDVFKGCKLEYNGTCPKNQVLILGAVCQQSELGVFMSNQWRNAKLNVLGIEASCQNVSTIFSYAEAKAMGGHLGWIK